MAAGQLNTFMDRLLALVPEDKKAEARSLYSGASDHATKLETAATVVAETAAKQHEWWEANKGVVAERNTLREQLAAKPAGEVVDTNAINEAIRKSNAETLETGLGLITAISTIVSRHMAEFGEPLDATKLAEGAITAKLPLDQFYNQTVHDRRTAKATEVRTAEDTRIRNEGIEQGRKEALTAAGKNGPGYPVGAQAPVTTLNGLQKPAEGVANPFSLEAATATAIEVMNRQNS